MGDAQVKLPNMVTDELYRASKRVTEEVVDVGEHNGTRWALVPVKIMARLKNAVTVADEHAPDDWRP